MRNTRFVPSLTMATSPALAPSASPTSIQFPAQLVVPFWFVKAEVSKRSST